MDGRGLAAVALSPVGSTSSQGRSATAAHVGYRPPAGHILRSHEQRRPA